MIRQDVGWCFMFENLKINFIVDVDLDLGKGTTLSGT